MIALISLITEKMNLNKLNELSKQAHEQAVKNGFWEKDYSGEHCLMMVISEISEAIEADRKGRHSNKLGFELSKENYPWEDSPATYEHFFNTHIKGTVEEELADAYIRLLDLAGAQDMDIPDDLSEYLDYVEDTLKELENRSFPEFCFDLCEMITRGCVIEAMCIIQTYCEFKNIDIFWHIEHKMQYNKTREYKHGKQY